MKVLRNNKGLTLVEILVVLVIGITLIILAWLAFGVGIKSYQSASDRIDVQSQFRLVVDILEEEIGHAKSVELHDYDSTDEVPDPGPKSNYIYLKDVGNGMYSLCKKDSSGEQVYETPFPLKGFEMLFKMDTTVEEANILLVYLNAEGADVYQTGILTQNTNIITSVPKPGGYYFVYYEEY
jgi:Tfp pilus assembly protein PilE